jgi:Integral membrane protein DUF95.
MSFAGDIAGIFRKDWKLFVASNVFLFGLFILGMLVGLAFPDVHNALARWIEQATATGPVSTASDTLKAGDIWLGTWQIFSHNYFITLAVSLVSLIFPPLMLFVFGIQFFAFGIVYSIPEMLSNPVSLIPVVGTLLLEGGGYVIAIFASMRLVEALIWPGRFGERSSIKAYLRAVADSAKLLLLAGIVLAVAALYEAASIVLIMGVGK